MRHDPSDNQDGTAPPPPVTQPNEFYFAAWRRAFDFRGVASRLEFWSFTLINWTVYFVLAAFLSPNRLSDSTVSLELVLIWCALLIPSLSVLIRRVRSATGSGWWVLIGWIPGIGWIVLLILCLLPGPGATRSLPSANRSTTTDDRPRWFDDDGPAAHRPMPAPTPTSDRQLTPDDVRPWWLKKDESGSTADNARAKPDDGRPRWFDDDGPGSRRGPKTQ